MSPGNLGSRFGSLTPAHSVVRGWRSRSEKGISVPGMRSGMSAEHVWHRIEHYGSGGSGLCSAAALVLSLFFVVAGITVSCKGY